jgi:hypothetical protein
MPGKNIRNHSDKMSVEKLTTLIPPPQNPYQAPDAAMWQQLETDLGFIFPSDYKECVSLYGSGEFSRYLYVTNPFQNFWKGLYYKKLTYREWTKQELDDYLSGKNLFPDEYPFSVYPAEGGLYPWAHVDDIRIYWQVQGNPDNWSIILYSGDYEYERWQLSTTDFLYKWLAGELGSKILTSDEVEQSFAPVFF